MITYSRGDVVFVDFPFKDIDEVKQRPALVVQDVGPGARSIVVAMITSKEERGENCVRVGVYSLEGTQMGLYTDSTLVLDNIATVSTALISRKMGSCPPSLMKKVDKILRKVFKL